MQRLIALAALAVFLCSCAAIGNPFASLEEIARAEAAADYAYCRSYGINPESEDMRRCMLARLEYRRQEELTIAARNAVPFAYAPTTQRAQCAAWAWDRNLIELECR